MERSVNVERQLEEFTVTDFEQDFLEALAEAQRLVSSVYVPATHPAPERQTYMVEPRSDKPIDYKEKLYGGGDPF